MSCCHPDRLWDDAWAVVAEIGLILCWKSPQWDLVGLVSSPAPCSVGWSSPHYFQPAAVKRSAAGVMGLHKERWNHSILHCSLQNHFIMRWSSKCLQVSKVCAFYLVQIVGFWQKICTSVVTWDAASYPEFCLWFCLWWVCSAGIDSDCAAPGWSSEQVGEASPSHVCLSLTSAEPQGWRPHQWHCIPL